MHKSQSLKEEKFLINFRAGFTLDARDTTTNPPRASSRILSQAFIWSTTPCGADEHDDANYSIPVSIFSPDNMTTVIGQVCRYQRRVTLSTPQLFTKICLESIDNLKDQVTLPFEVMQRWLRRSGKASDHTYRLRSVDGV